MPPVPPFLRNGDTIGIVCPAGFMAAEKILPCVNTLKSWGFRVRIGKTVGGTSSNYFSGTDTERLEDLQEMLDDEGIAAILFGRGGYGLSRIIDQLSFKKFKKSIGSGIQRYQLLRSHAFLPIYVIVA